MCRRIIFLSADYPPAGGGMSRHASAVAGVLHEEGRLAAVIAPADPHADDGLLPVRRLRSVPFDEVFTRYWRAVLEFFSAGRAFIKQEKDPVVFAHTWSPCGVAAYLLSVVYGIPYYVFAHGLDVYAPRRNLRTRLFMRWILSHARAVLCCSSCTAALVRRAAPAARAEVVHPFLEEQRARKFSAATDTSAGARPRLLSVSRLARHKGHVSVIRALPAIARRFPNVTYVIAGAGPHESVVRAAATEHGVADRTEFLGHVPDDELPALYASCDVFVLASEEQPDTGDIEGFGIVFLEAAASGKPAVAVRSGGVPDAVVDGETGLLVAVGDTAALADAVCRLLADHARARDMGEKGRQRVLRSFNAGAFLEKVRAVTEKI